MCLSGLQTVKAQLFQDPATLFPQIDVFKGSENTSDKNAYTNTHRAILYNSQKTDATQMCAEDKLHEPNAVEYLVHEKQNQHGPQCGQP